MCGDNMKPTKMAGSASWPRATPRGRNPAVTGLAMRLKRDRQTGGADASFKSSAFMSSLIESTRPPSAEYAEMYVAAVRSWLRSEWWAPQRRRLA